MGSLEQAGAEVIYDTAERMSLRSMAKAAWGLRELVLLLARREVSARFQSAALGAGWILITPFAYAAALWVVFSHIARFSTAGVPFTVYVLSGVIMLTFVSDAIMRIATSVVRNTVALRRVHAPVGAFAAAGALASTATLLITTASLLVVELLTGTGIPATALLLPAFFVPLVLAVGGVGLLVGALSALFSDAIEMTRIALTLAGFVTPVFYPISIIPPHYRIAVDVNPLYHFLVVFRDLAYGGQTPPLGSVAICVGTGLLAAVAGLGTFAWIRRTLPSIL